MLYSRRNKYEYKEGIVIASIRNLFHILDISRAKDNRDKLLPKSTTRSNFLLEQGLNKEKDNYFIKKGINKEREDHKLNKGIKDEENKGIKMNSKTKESKDEENKEIKMNSKSKENKEIKGNLKSKEIRDENKEIKGNITEKELKKYISTERNEKDVKFKLGKESTKNGNKFNKKNYNKNNILYIKIGNNSTIS